MLEDLQEFNHSIWNEILSLVQDSAVYIDHSAAECLHWYTGDKAYLTLKKSGAISVHELALYNIQYIKAKAKKAVIICTSTDSIFYQRTLQLIIDKNDFAKCIIICAAHKKILNYTSILPNEVKKNAYENLKEDVLHWMNAKNLSREMEVTMMFKPIFIAPVKKNLFVTPAFGMLMPNIDKKLSENIDDDIEFLVSSFHSLFSYFNAQEDIYSIGQLSNLIAEKLGNYPAAINRRKQVTSKQNISLILLDRSLDLSTATSYNTESIFGRILCTMSHLPHHKNDVAISMHFLCSEGEGSTSPLMVPGSISNNDEELMDILFNKNHRDILLVLNKMLLDIQTNKNSPRTNKISTRISAHSLEKGICKVRESGDLQTLFKYSKHLQIISAVVQSLKSPKTSQIEFLISLEKLILQNLAISGDSSSVLSQLSNIIKTRAQRDLDMENLLALLIHIYGIAGVDIQFSQHQEEGLKEALQLAIYEDIKKCNDNDSTAELSAYYQTLLLLCATDDDAAKEISSKISNKIMDILHKISQQRNSLSQYRKVINKPNAREMARHSGLLECLISDMLDTQRPKLSDLVYNNQFYSHSSFNLLTRSTEREKHPCDNPWIIIYVVGGITADEVKLVEDIVAKKSTKNVKITLGGTRLLSPLDIVDRILLTNINSI